jgi:hypothetical protein
LDRKKIIGAKIVKLTTAPEVEEEEILEPAQKKRRLEH